MYFMLYTKKWNNILSLRYPQTLFKAFNNNKKKLKHLNNEAKC